MAAEQRGEDDLRQPDAAEHRRAPAERGADGRAPQAERGGAEALGAAAGGEQDGRQQHGVHQQAGGRGDRAAVGVERDDADLGGQAERDAEGDRDGGPDRGPLGDLGAARAGPRESLQC